MRKRKYCKYCKRRFQLSLIDIHEDICKQRLAGTTIFECNCCKKEHDGLYGCGAFCSASCQAKKRESKFCNKCSGNVSISNYKKHALVCDGIKILAIDAYKINNNKYKCPYCEKIYPKMGIGTHIWYAHTDDGKQHLKENVIGKPARNRGMPSWNKGLTKKTDDRVKRYGDTLREGYKSGRLKSKKYKHTEETKEKLSKIAHQRIRDGYTASRGKRVKFKFDQDIIDCDSILEWACLKYITKNFYVKFINRSSLKLKWYDNCHDKHIYNPDFDILIEDDIRIIVECKYSEHNNVGYTDQLFVNYFDMAQAKRKILAEHCYKNNLGMIWYTQNWDIQGYNDALEKFRSLKEEDGKLIF